MDGHPSRRPVAGPLVPPTRDSAGRVIVPVWRCTGWGLPSRRRHRHRWCALTAPFHPYLRPLAASAVFSLLRSSVGFPRLGVTQHPALRCPDFPRGASAPQPSGLQSSCYSGSGAGRTATAAVTYASGMLLDGQTALVTGTGRGIGPAIAAALRAEGARVLCHARTEDDARRAATDLGGEPVWGDLGEAEGVAAAVGARRARAGARAPRARPQRRHPPPRRRRRRPRGGHRGVRSR